MTTTAEPPKQMADVYVIKRVPLQVLAQPEITTPSTTAHSIQPKAKSTTTLDMTTQNMANKTIDHRSKEWGTERVESGAVQPGIVKNRRWASRESPNHYPALTNGRTRHQCLTPHCYHHLHQMAPSSPLPLSPQSMQCHMNPCSSTGQQKLTRPLASVLLYTAAHHLHPQTLPSLAYHQTPPPCIKLGPEGPMSATPTIAPHLPITCQLMHHLTMSTLSTPASCPPASHLWHPSTWILLLSPPQPQPPLHVLHSPCFCATKQLSLVSSV